MSAVATSPPPVGKPDTKGFTCYNCGALDHYLNACPEPSREKPYGLLVAQAAKMNPGPQGYGGFMAQDNRALKRQKTGSGPIVTRYPVPPNAGTGYPVPGQPAFGTMQNGMPPQGFPPAGPYGQAQQPFVPQQVHGFPQYGYSQGPQVAGQYPQAQPYGAPMPAQGQPYGYSNPAAGNVNQQYGQYYGYGQAPSGPYGQLPNQFQPPAPQHFTPQYQPQYGQQYRAGPYPQQHGYPNQQFSRPGQPPHAPTALPGQQPAPFPYQGPSPPQPFIGATPSAQPPQAFNQPLGHSTQPPVNVQPPQQPPLSNQQGAPQQPVNAGPRSVSSSSTPAIIPSTGATESQVATSDSDIATNAKDELADSDPFEFNLEWEVSIDKDSFHPPAVAILAPLSADHKEKPVISAVTGPLKTKYVRPTNLEVFILPIEKSLHWAFVRGDPSFSPLVENAYPVVRLGKDLQKYLDERDAGVLGRPPEHTNPAPGKDGKLEEIVNAQTTQDAVEQTLQHPEKAIRQQSGQENNPRKRSATPTIEYQGHGHDAGAPQRGRSHESRERSVDPTEALLASLGVTGAPKPVGTAAPVSAPHTHPQNIYQSAPPPVRQDSGYISSRNSVATADNGKHSVSRQNSYNAHHAPPPPPPPPPRITTAFERHSHSPHSSTSKRSHSVGPGSGHTSNDRSPVESPLSPTSAALLGIGSAAKGPVRQAEDTFVKKKPQPKVADAYSRRW